MKEILKNYLNEEITVNGRKNKYSKYQTIILD